MPESEPYKPKNQIRIVTATSLFDGHDAAINIMRRIMQDSGAEVIHLGHNRSAREIVTAAVQEDAQALAVTCYQGGHLEFYKYIVDLLKEAGAGQVKVFGGGGGVILPDEIAELETYGVTKIYSPEDGRKLGLQGMINHLLRQADFAHQAEDVEGGLQALDTAGHPRLARLITVMENLKAGGDDRDRLESILNRLRAKVSGQAPVIGLTGPGGAGKSSLVDEIVLRFNHDFPGRHAAILSVDPSRRKTGGALLGDRIRINSLTDGRVYMRSMATRSGSNEVPDVLGESILALKAAGFDLIIVETAGIGQGDAAVATFADVSLYVMTSEFGAPSQLEKIDMLDFADLVVINKFDRQGSEDALRDVRKQFQRNHRLFDRSPEKMPVYGAIAARFNNDGVTAIYQAVLDLINEKTGAAFQTKQPRLAVKAPSSNTIIIPPERNNYLADIARIVRKYHTHVAEQAELAEKIWRLDGAIELIDGQGGQDEALRVLKAGRAEIIGGFDPDCDAALNNFKVLQQDYRADEYVYRVRDTERRDTLYRESLAGTRMPRISLPAYRNPGDILRWLLLENVPGRFPYTAGVFPFKRTDEDPARMFAGEGDPARTNRRFKYLSRNTPAKRLSTAFDSVTLYGRDPDEQPDVYGKLGTSGVSICTLDDVKILYGGFDLCAPNNSVSMTINGPAPIMLAMFFNAALDQRIEAFEEEHHRPASPEEKEDIRRRTLRQIRGTVQADILKEDQGQNTCVFSIDFALKMMGDIQAYFIENDIRNFYSVSISGYHIAEAGANPITQLAFTLANGFTYVEYYLARGMKIDDFAENLSFFFSNGMDPEYAVINRVARRIWAVAMRDYYGAGERSRKLKAHIQTSGRSLHSREIQFNDIRTTLQALTALYDNCNSLHTNSYDEAVTTPTEESVRRALAIQMIINREYGLYKNENPTQGSFIIEELTGLVEEAVLAEFDRLSQRGGVLGAMETGYQRSRIQDESLYYEMKKQTGDLPIIGVNTFLNPEGEADHLGRLELSRATEEEKAGQLKRLADFKNRHAGQAPQALAELKKAALSGENIFAELMNTVRYCSLGQISEALYEAGGRYRRNM